MKTAGSADASLLVRGADNGAGRGAGPRAGLKAGAVVFVEVRERLAPDSYRIAVGTRLMTASSRAVLEPGSLLKARVERSGDGFILRLLDAGRGPRDAAAQAILKAGLPLDAASRAALAALLGAGMSPDAAALGRVRQAALRGALRAAQGAAAAGSDDESGLVELAARMEAKGIDAEESALDALASAGDGRSGGRFTEGKGDGDDRGKGSDGGGDSPEGLSEGAAEPIHPEDLDFDADFSRYLPERDLPAGLGAFLKVLILRAGGERESSAQSSGASGGEDSESLGLFNHAKGKDGAWLLVPFRFALDSVAFAGSFRIQLPYVPGGPGRIDARFDSSGEGRARTWIASLSFGGGARPALRLEAPGDAEPTRFRPLLDSFRAEMAALGLTAASSPRTESQPYAEPPSAASGRAGGGGFDLDA
jgi:hypothetical protein